MFGHMCVRVMVFGRKIQWMCDCFVAWVIRDIYNFSLATYLRRLDCIAAAGAGGKRRERRTKKKVIRVIYLGLLFMYINVDN